MRSRTRLVLLVAAALLAEAVQLPLYAAAFGGPVAGLMAVRTVLAVVLAVFALRASAVARVVLGSLRLLAGLVGIVMATVVADAPGLAVALGAVCTVDTALGMLLLLLPAASVESGDVP